MMHRDDRLRSTRRSYTYYPMDDPVITERMQAAVPVEGYYTYLLFQDLDHVFPYGVGRSSPRVQIVGPDAEHASPLIAASLSERSFPSLDEAVRKFVSSTAQYLVFGGSCTYEIDYLYPADTDSDDEPVAFGLELIQPGTLGTRDGAPIQYVLPSISETHDSTGLSYVTLDPSTLVVFTLPRDLVTPVRTLIEFLMTANGERRKEFELTLQSTRETTPYNFSAHQREKGRLFAEVTQPIGWNVRDSFKDDQLEPFSVWRQIRFLEFKVIVRDSIIEQLNTAIGQVGKRMGFSASITVTGVPTLSDVQQAKDDFRNGVRGLGALATATI
jgi:hypothetical protein